MLYRLKSEMVNPEVLEDRKYTANEVREILAAKELDKARAASELLTRMSYLEGVVKGFGGFSW